MKSKVWFLVAIISVLGIIFASIIFADSTENKTENSQESADEQEEQTLQTLEHEETRGIYDLSDHERSYIYLSSAQLNLNQLTFDYSEETAQMIVEEIQEVKELNEDDTNLDELEETVKNIEENDQEQIATAIASIEDITLNRELTRVNTEFMDYDTWKQEIKDLDMEHIREVESMFYNTTYLLKNNNDNEYLKTMQQALRSRLIVPHTDIRLLIDFNNYKDSLIEDNKES